MVATKVLHVRSWAGGWGVFGEPDREAAGLLATQADAVARAKELARGRREGVQVVVHGKDGRVVAEFFFLHVAPCLRRRTSGADEEEDRRASEPAAEGMTRRRRDGGRDR